MFARLIKLLPQSDIRDFSIDDADVEPPFERMAEASPR